MYQSLNICGRGYKTKKIKLAENMGLRSFLSQCSRTLKLARRPGKSELWLSIKMCLLGIGAVGLIGYIIKLLASIPQLGALTS